MHLTKLNIRPNRRGDTIVEVLLCIAIVGAVIAGAYALASRSLMQGVNASERTEAIKLAEGQVEALKFRQKPDKDLWEDNFVESSMDFCLDPTVASHKLGNGSLNPRWNPLENDGNPDDLQAGAARYEDSLNAATGNTACVVNNKYFISITTPSAASTNPTYLITVRWAPAGQTYDPAVPSTYGRLNKAQIYYRF